MRRIHAFFIIIIALASACGPRNSSSSKREKDSISTRSFPSVEIPAMLTDSEDKLRYMLNHYWDAYFAAQGQTDSTYILGVADEEVSSYVGAYVNILLNIDVHQAQVLVRSLFDKIEQAQKADDNSLIYLRLTEIVSSFLYDPNSPMRSEDLYLPFVEGMAASPYTSEDKRPGYKFQLEKCRLNPYGDKAPDFKFLDIRDRRHSLYETSAQYCMLFFSNPGCQACQEIIDQIATRPYIDSMIADGTLAIINIYIDEEYDRWREYVGNYPTNWLNGYDPYQVISSDQLYFVRAIPSLYILDSQKRVLHKDIPVERALAFLDNIKHN